MCFKFLLKNIIPCPNIKLFDRFLFIGAHIGDIEKAAGATVNKLVKQGKNVKFLITTDSATFKSDKSLEERKEIRQKEAIASAAMLNVKNIEFLPFADCGKLNPTELFEELSKVINDFNPDVIFIDDTTTPNEINVDDRLTTRIVEDVVTSATVKNIKALAYYNTIKPNFFFKVTNSELYLKLCAITTFLRSAPIKENEKIAYIRSYKSLINLTALKYGLKSGKFHAEAFRVVSISATHNLPQINF